MWTSLRVRISTIGCRLELTFGAIILSTVILTMTTGSMCVRQYRHSTVYTAQKGNDVRDTDVVYITNLTKEDVYLYIRHSDIIHRLLL